MVLVATQVKRRRGTTAENDAFTGAEGEIVVDTERHELRVHDGVTQGGFRIGGGSGSGRNIGDTFLTKRTDTNLAGAVECDGATYNTTDFTGDGSIGELLEAGKLDYISLSAYSTAISTKGWCDKIGWDGTGTTAFRVPTLNAHIVQTNNIPVIGNGGRTNMYNTAGSTSDHGMALASSGSIYLENVANSALGFSTDSTKSGLIADTTDTAQLRVMIQLFNGATDEAVATCTSVLSDVADLKDLSNITADGKEVCANMAMPSNRYIGLTLGASGTTYTAPADGWFCISKKTNGTNQVVNLINSNSTGGGIRTAVRSPISDDDIYIYLPAKRGDVIVSYYSAGGTTEFFRFIYAKGAQ